MSQEILKDEAAKSFDELNSGISQVNEVLKRNEKLRADDQEKIDKMSVDTGEALKKLNDYEVQQKAKDERIENLEKSLEMLQAMNSRSVATVSDKLIRTEEEKKDYEISRKFLISGSPAVQAECLPYLKEMSLKNSVANLRKVYPYASDSDLMDVAKTWNEGSNPEGGYFVRPELANFFITRDLNSGSLRPWSNIQFMRSNQMDILIDDDISKRANWVSELNKPQPEETAQIGQATLVLKNLSRRVLVTYQLLEDSLLDIEGYVLRKLNESFDLSENDAYLTGNGANEIKGLLEYDDWDAPGQYTRDAIERIVTEVAGEISYNDIVDISASVIPTYLSNSRWFMGQSTWGAISKIKSDDGMPLLNQLNSLEDGVAGILRGYPVTLLNQMPAFAAGSQALIFGDMARSVTIGDRGGMFLLKDPYTFQNCLSFGGRKRTGMILSNFEALKIGQIKA